MRNQVSVRKDRRVFRPARLTEKDQVTQRRSWESLPGKASEERRGIKAPENEENSE